MSSYAQLADHLAQRQSPRWQASFAEIESIIGRKLPESAYRHPAWWANQTGKGHTQTRGWRGAGWRTSKINLAERKVVFERESAMAPNHASEIDRLIKQAQTLSGISDRDEIIAAALKEYNYRIAIEGLIATGGTMPDFEAAPRKRPFA